MILLCLRLDDPRLMRRSATYNVMNPGFCERSLAKALKIFLSKWTNLFIFFQPWPTSYSTCRMTCLLTFSSFCLSVDFYHFSYLEAKRILLSGKLCVFCFFQLFDLCNDYSDILRNCFWFGPCHLQKFSICGILFKSNGLCHLSLSHSGKILAIK